MRSVSRNRYQKAAHRAGDVRVRRAQVDQLLALSGSSSAEDRLVAAKFLCPCHVRGRTDDIWDAVVRLMADDDPRIRFAAWHTLEDGGVPAETGVLERLEELLLRESNPTVLRLAKDTIGPLLAQRDRQQLGLMRHREPAMRGKCDFCGERNVTVRRELETRIPTSGLSRTALICRRCDVSTEAGKTAARRA